MSPRQELILKIATELAVADEGRSFWVPGSEQWAETFVLRAQSLVVAVERLSPAEQTPETNE